MRRYITEAVGDSLTHGRPAPNEIAGANAGLRIGFAERSRVVLSVWPGVARLRRYASGASQTEVPEGRYESSPGQARNERRPG